MQRSALACPRAELPLLLCRRALGADGARVAVEAGGQGAGDQRPDLPPASGATAALLLAFCTWAGLGQCVGKAGSYLKRLLDWLALPAGEVLLCSKPVQRPEHRAPIPRAGGSL